uniref:hypothetical protein n=1 Tax=uncultured Bacteroides sp. TaxID=162156 RepID=UPI00280B62CD|nr:hypothetical protein [uncultured Bacteroides sp.]
MKGDLIFGELSSIVFMWVILFLLFLILSICLNQLVKYTFSYKNFFVHTNSLSFRSRNSDDCIEKYKVVSLGSNNALFSFHFQDIIGANWSTGLQTTYENFGVLKKYHGNINECGFVIFTLAPLGTILKTTDFDRWHRVKYCYILPEFLNRKEKLFVRYPLFMDPVFSIKALLGAFLGCVEKDSRLEVACQRLDKRKLKVDAQMWVDGWKKQFGISDLNAPLSTQNMEKQHVVIKLYQEIIEFVVQRGYKPVFVMPPVTRELGGYFSNTFFENYIYPFTDSFKDVHFLNYFNDPDFNDPNLYFNSFFLNLNGRKVFTQRVLADLNLIP